MGEQRREFSKAFKREAVRLAYESGRRLADVARELELRPDMIRRWRRELDSAPHSRATRTNLWHRLGSEALGQSGSEGMGQ